MADQPDRHGAAGGRGEDARGGHGAGARGGAAARGAQVCTTHVQGWLKLGGNPNHGEAKGKAKKKDDDDITLTTAYLHSEASNIENETLVEVYNELKNAGKQYAMVLATTEIKKKQRANKDLERLEGNFSDICMKVKPQQALVRSHGGIPVPFPGHVLRKLPNKLQMLLREHLRP